MLSWKEVQLDWILLDTGSAGTVFNADVVEKIDVVEPGDILNKIKGVGGVEVVYSKCFDFVRFGEASMKDFEAEIGEKNYGMKIDNIFGFDFIRETSLFIDSKDLQNSVHR